MNDEGNEGAGAVGGPADGAVSGDPDGAALGDSARGGAASGAASDSAVGDVTRGSGAADATAGGGGSDAVGADAGHARRAVEAVWRGEAARLVATLTRTVGDFGLAEDLAQEALVDALAQWPASGVPTNPGAWLTTVAKRKAIDHWRRRERFDDRFRLLAAELAIDGAAAGATGRGAAGSGGHGASATSGTPLTAGAADATGAPLGSGASGSGAGTDGLPDLDGIDDDVLRLVFISCHPVLAREQQIALTLRVVGGLTSDEIARAFLVPTATVQQRIVRAKKTLAAAAVPFEVPPREQFAERLGSVLGVLYLVYNEGYAATAGEEWMRPELAREALRLARVLAELVPREPEVHALVALMEFQSSRFAARVTRTGEPILLLDQDRTRWDRAQIARGSAALRRADALGRGRAAYGLQAAIAECHATAATAAETPWERIVVLYEALGRLAPSPVVELNRAAAVSMAVGPASALRIVDELRASGALAGSYLLPSVRGELLARLGPEHAAEARTELETAARLTANARERATLLAKAAALPS